MSGRPAPLTELQLDVLRELVNIGVGHAAGILNRMIHSHIRLQAPETRILDDDGLAEYLLAAGRDQVSAVVLDFQSDFSGTAALIFPPESATSLVSMLIGEDDFPLDQDSLRIGTLQEVGNIVLNGVLGTFGNILGEHIDYSPPGYFEDAVSNLGLAGRDGEPVVVLLCRTPFWFEDKQIQGEVLLVFLMSTFHVVLEALDRIASGEQTLPPL